MSARDLHLTGQQAAAGDHNHGLVQHADWHEANSTKRDVLPEERMRAGLYHLLAHFLFTPPGDELLKISTELDYDRSTKIGEALVGLVNEAKNTDATSQAAAFHELFIGLGRGELVPFGSFYLTGFLNEKPLAKLRQRLDQLSIERDFKQSLTEDHIAVLMDIMANGILGVYGTPFSYSTQRVFFIKEIDTWAPAFFKDLKSQDVSALYKAVGQVGCCLVDIEREAFSMLEEEGSF